MRPLPRHDRRVRALVLRCGWNATAYQLLNPGLAHWLSPDGEAAVGYVPARRQPLGRRAVWVAAGEPVCEAEEVGHAAGAFEAEAARHGARVCWFDAGARLHAVRAGLPDWCAVPVGAQPVWTPGALAERFVRKASLRAQLYRALNKGVEVDEWPTASADVGRLRPVLAAWLATRGLPPMHFLVEPDTLGRLADRRAFVAERAGAVVGFAVLSPVPARRGWLVEQVIRRPGAPNGTAELLLDAAARATAADGDGYLTLGLVPLSPHGGAAVGPLWQRALLGWVRAHARRFYDFEGLERFKAKFLPERWEPLYLLAQERSLTPGTLYAVADAFAGPQSPERLVGRALAHALGDEVRRLSARAGRS